MLTRIGFSSTAIARPNASTAATAAETTLEPTAGFTARLPENSVMEPVAAMIGAAQRTT